MELIRVGVLGATSMVGDSLLPQLQQAYAVVPFSRQITAPTPGVKGGAPTSIPCWISLMPIWALPDYFEALSALGARRVVTLSSTSVFTKKTSSDSTEQALEIGRASCRERVYVLV